MIIVCVHSGWQGASSNGVLVAELVNDSAPHPEYDLSKM